jgi:hypothetical protein
MQTSTRTAASTVVNTMTITPTLTPLVLPTGEPILFPNPYCPRTALNGTLNIINLLPGSQVYIYSISGEAVANIKTQSTAIYWSGKNNNNSPVSPGIYYYMIISPSNSKTLGRLFIVSRM